MQVRQKLWKKKHGLQYTSFKFAQIAQEQRDAISDCISRTMNCLNICNQTTGLDCSMPGEKMATQNM